MTSQSDSDEDDGQENAEPDSRYWSRDAEQIVNESSLLEDQA